MTKKVIVGMSGGVDSSVSAALLLEQGYHVEGLFMKNWEEDDGTEYCTALDDLADAQAVADRLNIKLHTANFAMEYWDRVFEYFLAEYSAGRTPNPDILCNKEIKFRAFLDYAIQLGADYIATGHYARRGETLINSQGKEYTTLHRGLDQNKDQTYFLHAVNGVEIHKTLFPIGELKKPTVRQIAEKLNLATAKKKDSTGICFIGERRFNDFLKQYLPAQKGEIVLENGQVVGEHQGLMYYTLGQRAGIGLGGMKNTQEGAWFVLHKDLSNNRLVVGKGHENPLLLSHELITQKVDWVASEQFIPEQGLICTAKTRYRQPDQLCTIFHHEQGGVRVVFHQAQRASTAGQSCVFYQKETCLGGGVIQSTNAPLPAYLQ